MINISKKHSAAETGITRSLLLLLALFIVTPVFAQQDQQDSKKKHITTGLYGGINFTNFRFDSTSFTSSVKTGYQLGGFYRRGRTFYWQLGLEYQISNVKLNFPDSLGGGGGEINGDLEMHRLQLPLYVGLNLIPLVKKVVNVRVDGGIIPSYLIQLPNNDLNITASDLHGFRTVGTVGVGVDVLVFTIDAGRAWSFNHVFTGNPTAKEAYTYLNLGLRF